MSTTSFDGPIKAGDILNTVGTTLGDDVSNVGFATMVQVYSLSQASADPRWIDIVIPANSQITRMAVLVTTAGDTKNIAIGRDDSVGSGSTWFANTVTGTFIGLKEVEGSKVTDPSRWKDVGNKDVQLTADWAPTGSDPGRAMLIVEYIQNNNLT